MCLKAEVYMSSKEIIHRAPALVRHSVEASRKGIVMTGKYTPLEDYLRGLPVSQREVVLSFEQIERIINAKLPASAYGYQQWWDNEKEGNHVNGRAWANAGWKVESVDFHRKQTRLVRAESDAS